MLPPYGRFKVTVRSALRGGRTYRSGENRYSYGFNRKHRARYAPLVDSSSEAALTTLTAFIGAVIGIIGCFAGALRGDAMLCSIAALGSVACFIIWLREMIAFDPLSR